MLLSTDEMDLQWVPIIKSWRLNERHYGALTGKSKKMVGNIYGEDQLKRWRRGYTIRPPAGEFNFSSELEKMHKIILLTCVSMIIHFYQLLHTHHHTLETIREEQNTFQICVYQLERQY